MSFLFSAYFFCCVAQGRGNSRCEPLLFSRAFRKRCFGGPVSVLCGVLTRVLCQLFGFSHPGLCASLQCTWSSSPEGPHLIAAVVVAYP